MKNKKEAIEPLYLDGKGQWHQWLENHHTQEDGVWLVIRKKHADAKGVYHMDAVEEALCYGWIDGQMYTMDENNFMLKFTPRRLKSPWSMINRKKAEKLMEEGRMTEAGLEKIEEARKNGMWDTAYTSRKAESIPVALEAALKADPEAWVNFTNFANSYKNNYIGWVNEAKKDETKRRRIEIVVRRSKANKKPGMDMS